MSASTRTSKANSKASLTAQTQQLRRNLQTPIPAPRIALERKISLRFPHFQGFLTEYCSNVSITGMFIQSNEPRPPGEILDFEFDLIDGLQLIRGTGEIIWVRLTDEGPDLPAGMGIRFLRLDAQSRRLIRWAVEKQISAGGQTFDLDAYRSEAMEVSGAAAPERNGEGRQAPKPASASAAVVDARRRHPYAGYAMARRSTWQTRLLATASVALPVVILATAVLVSYPRSESVAFATAPPPEAQATFALGQATATDADSPAEDPAASSQADGPEVAEAEAPADPEAELIEATLDWAQAWAEQRPEAYLRRYSNRFQPPQSLSRGVWEQQRKERIAKPRFIQVDVSSLETELLDPEHARVTFDQAYRSDNYRDAMRKTLDLVREDGSWKIVGEHAAS